MIVTSLEFLTPCPCTPPERGNYEMIGGWIWVLHQILNHSLRLEREAYEMTVVWLWGDDCGFTAVFNRSLCFAHGILNGEILGCVEEEFFLLHGFNSDFTLCPCPLKGMIEEMLREGVGEAWECFIWFLKLKRVHLIKPIFDVFGRFFSIVNCFMVGCAVFSVPKFNKRLAL